MLDHLPGFERHLKVLNALTDVSAKVYTSRVREFCTWWTSRQAVRPAPPSPSPASIPSRQDIEAFLEHCFYQGNNNHTRLTKLIAIRKFFRYMLYEGHIPADPSAQIPLPKVRKTLVQRFTKEEILRLFTIAAAPPITEKSLRDAVILILGAFCGLRIGEIITLTLANAVEEGQSYDIHVYGKGEKWRKVYLWKAPSAILRAWYLTRVGHGARPSDPLIISYGRGARPKHNPLTASATDAFLKTLAARAQIRKPKLSMHMLRAAHAHDLRHIKGYDTPAIAERLGHASIITTDRYVATRGRLHQTYPSLAVYWREFNSIFEGRQIIDEHDDDRTSRPRHRKLPPSPTPSPAPANRPPGGDPDEV